MDHRITLALASCAAAWLSLPGCANPSSAGDSQDVVEQPDTRVCAALRGNGPRITAHFGAMARVVEHVGMVDGIAGGSSGSVTSFLTESIEQNPHLSTCDDPKLGPRPCREDERRARAALLFKSLFGYVEKVGSDDEVSAFATLGEVAARVQEAGIPALLEDEPTAGVEALIALLTSDDLRDLINGEVVDLLKGSPDPVFHARDVVSSLSGGLSFSVDDPKVMLRPGLVDFDAFARKLGRVGSFYAGWAPADGRTYAAWLDDCAVASRGMSWFEAATVETDAGTCGARFQALVGAYRAALRADEVGYPSRIDAPIGERFTTVVGTAVLTGEAAQQWRAARQAYLAAESISWDIDFADVRFAYWAGPDASQAIADNPGGFDDAKTARRLVMPAATWAEALALSPAEPGLARGFALPSERGEVVSVGGWSDLMPVEVLENAGCDTTVYITRRKPERSGFEVDVARLLGLDDADEDAIFNLDRPDSAASRALSRAGAVWCTDWDGPDLLDLPAMEAEGYEAPMEIHDPFFLGLSPLYPGATLDLGIRGCTPGAAAPEASAD